MKSDHTQLDPVRAYFLGLLSPDEAEHLEQRYFQDDALLREVKEAERDLIRDFLDGKLPDFQKRLFEARYLTAWSRRKLVAEVKRAHGGATTATLFPSRRTWLAAGTTVALIVAGAAIWYSQHFRAASKESALLAVRLAPGIGKSSSPSGRHSLVLPPAPRDFDLVLELPGIAPATVDRTRISVIEADGSPRHVLTVDRNSLGVQKNIGEFHLRLSTSHFAPGDYLIEILNAADSVLDGYALSVAPTSDPGTPRP